MIKAASRTELRKKRHLRLRKKVLGTKERPRVHVFRSCRHLYLQLTDDTEGRTLCSVSTLAKELKDKELGSFRSMEAAKALAEVFAQKLKERNVSTVVFDRSGYCYHGKVKAMAEVLRERGLLA